MTNTLPIKDPDKVLGWLKKYAPNLLLELLLTDEFWSAVLFQDKQVHTISWHIATLAKAGLPIAQQLCQALNMLSSDHCKAALDSGV